MEIIDTQNNVRGGGGEEECHLEGQQQRPPFFTPQVGQDGHGDDRDHQAHQDPDLQKTVSKCRNMKNVSYG